MNQETDQKTRLDLARQAATELLEELETGETPVAQSLMRAKRLARLLRDEEAQRWLDLEIKGYPQDLNFGTLGSCLRYATEGGRVTHEGKYWTKSLSFDAVRHDGDKVRAKQAYEEMIRMSFCEAHRVLKPDGAITAVYAHKTTLGWATLVDALRRSGFTVTEAWPRRPPRRRP